MEKGGKFVNSGSGRIKVSLSFFNLCILHSFIVLLMKSKSVTIQMKLLSGTFLLFVLFYMKTCLGKFVKFMFRN